MERNKRKNALPLVVVIAVLLAFSSSAVADYSGDHPLAIYDHDTINGSLVYETVTDGSKYKCLYPQQGDSRHPFVFLYQNLTITLPEGATVKTARLYNYYTWSCWQDSSTIGVPAQATLNLTDTTSGETWTRTCSHSYTPATRDDCPNPIVYFDGDVVHYWDTKSQNYSSKMWDVPSGTFAWNVTGLVTHSGTYNASIRDSRAQGRVGDERFCTFGFGLLVVYEKPSSPEIEYGIAEGCDILNNCSGGNWETWENATTNATFGGVSGATDANLTTVLDCSDGGSMTPAGNMIYFNGEEIGSSTAEGIVHIGVNYFNVTSLLSPDENVVGFQDRGDYEGVHNAFLVVEYGEEAQPKPDLVITDKWVCWPANCTICYNLTNTGNGTATAGHNTTVYVDGNETAQDEVPVDLAPNASYIGCFDGYNWAYTPPEDNITVCADNNNTVDESNESNNCLTNWWMCGDVDGDRFVTGYDSYLVYIEDIRTSEWAADADHDEYITGYDSYLVYIEELNCKCSS